jgi:hypothetical protein
MIASRTVRDIHVAVFLLGFHTCLLAWCAFRDSPTDNELAHLTAGISHWLFGRFDLYRVNPPLVRLVAALPVLPMDYHANWTAYTDAPHQRPEFAVAGHFLRANGMRSATLLRIARLACIPFSLLGGWICMRWAGDLYGRRSGLVALALWCLCPNIIAYGHLITPDVGATSLGLAASYSFARWWKSPTWRRASGCGVVLGLAELVRTTWIILPPLWSLTWLCAAAVRRRGLAPGNGRPFAGGQLCWILALALLLLNLGYGCSGTLQQLRSYDFESRLFSGRPLSPTNERPRSNRFSGTWLGSLVLPFPRDYVLGIDRQREDFESMGTPSYLNGELREIGWWSYYFWGLAVKTPLPVLCLFVLACVQRLVSWRAPKWNDELFLVVPAITVGAFVSSQSGFSQHFRYVLPVLPFAFIWTSQVVQVGFFSKSRMLAVTVLLTWLVASSLFVYPHSLSFFNEIAGGPLRGHAYLAHSSVDWGQDLLYLGRWADAHLDARPLHTACFGNVRSEDLGIPSSKWPREGQLTTIGNGRTRHHWCALSINVLRGISPFGHATELLIEANHYHPMAYAGYSIYIYRLSEADLERLQMTYGRWPANGK